MCEQMLSLQYIHQLSKQHLLVFAALFIFSIALDQWVKFIMLEGFVWESEAITIGGRALVYNKGVAFSMFSFLEEYLKSHFTSQIKIIPQIPIQNQEHLQSYFQEILARNGEGLILRDNINSNIAYKYKAYEDSECEVIGYTQGKGKFKGQLGAILCQAFIDGAYKTFKIGSGFSNKERKSPPPLHSIITYKYFGFTANKLPKFPIFLRVRDKNF